MIRNRSGWAVMLTALNYFLLSVFALAILLPFLNVFALSFNGGKDAAAGGVTFWPRALTLANFKEVFLDKWIIVCYRNTIIRTVLGTVLGCLCTAMAAFALKFKDMPGHGLFTTLIVVTMLFGGNIIAYYIVLKTLGLVNNFLVYIIPSLYSAWNIILVRSFFESLGSALDESAKIDGAGYFRIFWQITMPLSTPVIAVIALYCAVGHWSDWFTGVFYVSKKELRPVASLLQEMLTQAAAAKNSINDAHKAATSARYQVTSDSMKMATVIITMAPIMAVYPFVQKYFTQGIMVGAIKG